jgi:hypothetical protein
MNVHITNATLAKQFGVCVTLRQVLIKVFLLQVAGRAVVTEKERRWNFDEVWWREKM